MCNLRLIYFIGLPSSLTYNYLTQLRVSRTVGAAVTSTTRLRLTVVEDRHSDLRWPRVAARLHATGVGWPSLVRERLKQSPLTLTMYAIHRWVQQQVRGAILKSCEHRQLAPPIHAVNFAHVPLVVRSPEPADDVAWATLQGEVDFVDGTTGARADDTRSRARPVTGRLVVHNVLIILIASILVTVLVAVHAGELEVIR